MRDPGFDVSLHASAVLSEVNEPIQCDDEELQVGASLNSNPIDPEVETEGIFGPLRV